MMLRSVISKAVVGLTGLLFVLQSAFPEALPVAPNRPERQVPRTATTWQAAGDPARVPNHLPSPADTHLSGTLYGEMQAMVPPPPKSEPQAAAKEALAAMAQGDMLRTLLAALRRWLKSVPADLVRARRALASETIARRRYAFDIH